MEHPLLSAGGGIGGLAAALGLAHRGFQVQGLERAGNFKQFFEEIAASNGAKAYRVINH